MQLSCHEFYRALHFALLGFTQGFFNLFIGANKCQKSRLTAALQSVSGGQEMVALNVANHISVIS